MTWPLPELTAGAELGELSPPDEELPELPDPPVVPDEPCRVLLEAEPDDVPADAEAAPVGRVNATAPAAMMLAAAAETVAARSRALPRSLAATRSAALRL